MPSADEMTAKLQRLMPFMKACGIARRRARLHPVVQSVRGLAHNNGICGLRAPHRAEPLGASRRLALDEPRYGPGLLTRPNIRR